MAEPSPLFKTLAIEPDPPAAPPPSQQDHARAIALIQVALSTIWQQFVVATSHMFTLLSAGSVFVLFYVTADPNTHQLVMLGGYALFVLAANWLVIGSRKR